MSWFWFAVIALFSFYGSKRTHDVTRINFLGLTLYERRRDPSLPPPAATFALTDGEDEERQEEEVEEDDNDERDLWERLEDAGFPVMDPDERRGLRLADVGSIQGLDSEADCNLCDGDLYSLYEIIRSELQEGRSIAGAKSEYLGRVCEGCGYTYSVTDGSRSGKLAPHVDVNVNFFDVLEYFENVRAGDAEGAAGQADLSLLVQRRDQLEGELNEVRLAIKRKETENGQQEPYRDTQRAAP